jgi:hypothetical protein
VKTLLLWWTTMLIVTNTSGVEVNSAGYEATPAK